MAAARGILVGGSWAQAASGETMEVLNPATEEVLAVVPRCGAEDVDAAVEAARSALPEWLDSTPGERSEMLLRLARVLEENADELAGIESANVGKPLAYAKDELSIMADHMRFFAGAARVLEGKSTGEYRRGYTSMIRREPLGVVGGIAPWNYPLMMAVWKLGPALAAGNVQVLKPSEQTPLSLLRFAELAEGVLPPGVLNVVTGDGVPVGERIVTHPDVRLVSLTGDVETGKTIARTAADTLKRVHLELGGKAPVVVFDDADPAAVAEAIKDRRLLELGAGLHRGVARGRRAGDLRGVARGARARGGVARRRRSGGRGRDRHGAGDLALAAGARARVPRARLGRDGADGRRRRRTGAGTSSRRPSSRTSGSATRSSSARCSGRS